MRSKSSWQIFSALRCKTCFFNFITHEMKVRCKNAKAKTEKERLPADQQATGLYFGQEVLDKDDVGRHRARSRGFPGLLEEVNVHQRPVGLGVLGT